MAKARDFTKTMQDMMANFPSNMSSIQDAMKSQGVLSEKLARVALAAAERSTEISARWAKDSMACMGELAAHKDEPSDYTRQSAISRRVRPNWLLSTWPHMLKWRRRFSWTRSS